MKSSKLLRTISSILISTWIAFPSSAKEPVQTHLEKLVSLTDKPLPFKPRPRFIVLDFWASWCEPCKESAPFIESQALKWKSKDVLWLGVSEDEDKKSALDYLQKTKSQIPQSWDEGKQLGQRLEMDSLPRLYILDSKDEVIYMERGFNGEKKKRLEKKFQDLFEKAALH